MTDSESAALEVVISRTGVVHYRHLASDANTLPAPNDPATWRRWLVEEAARPAGESGTIRVNYGTSTPGRPCCP